jgi:predicted molibdopterin-dependent oxidoreductase YjgC
MFKRLDDNPQDAVTIFIDGTPHAAMVGETIAAALLAAGFDYSRTTPVSQSPRAPFCLMGVCYECLVVIDGQPNQRACQVLVHDGMQVQRQKGSGPVPE